jgi:pyruvate,orthophosphate dikinase
MFFHTAGVDSVSCSPFRIPIAKLAAAQGAILDNQIAAARNKLRPLG